MDRSNINLVGNTTQGLNVGGGAGVFKSKLSGNILQYKTLSVAGTTMEITSDADNIYFSAGTGGGGVTSVSAGSGMSFTTITGIGSVNMGTPTTLSLLTTNSVAGSTHTHALSIASFVGSSAGLVPTSVGGTTNFLRADGQWAEPPSGSGLWSVVGTTCITPVGIYSPYFNSGTVICWGGDGFIKSEYANSTCHDLCLYNDATQFIKMHTNVSSDCIGIQLASESSYFTDPVDRTQGLEICTDTTIGTANIIGGRRGIIIQPTICDSGTGRDVKLMGGQSSFGGGGSVHIVPGQITGTGSLGTLYMCNLSSVNGACTLHIASNVVSYFVNASDCRLKCNLVAITGATSMLDGICGYSAEYNTISELSGICEYVMLAQDIEQVLPLAVFDDVCASDETYKRIEYKQLIPVMWNIIKEQEIRIKALEANL